MWIGNKSVGRALLFFLVPLLSFSCHSFRPDRQEGNLPIIPSYIHDPREQLDYYVTHYWDYIDLKDSVSSYKGGQFDTLLWDYLSLLGHVDNPTKDQIIYPLERLEGGRLIKALLYYKKHLYEEPISAKGEYLYREVALWASHSPKVPIEYQTESKELADLLQRNCVGHQASDFVYANDSATFTLFPIRESYRLLVFTRGQDSTYVDVERYIQREPIYARMAKRGQLSVQVVQVQHESEHLKHFLATDTLRPKWLERTIDPRDSIVQYRLYDLKEKLTLYLITKQGKVALKAPKLEQLTQYLERNEK